MSEALASAAGGDEDEFGSLRSSLILSAADEVDSSYPLAVIAVPREGGDRVLVAAALIAEASDAGIIAAFPSRCWHRAPSNRVLSLDYIRRVSAVRVHLAEAEDRAVDSTAELRVCVGILTAVGEAAADFVRDLEGDVTIDFPFGQGDLAGAYPSATGLVEAARSFFEFHTAESGEPPRSTSPVAATAGFEGRLSALEACFRDIQGSLRTLTQQARSSPAEEPPRASPKVKAKSQVGSGADRVKKAPREVLDPAVAKAAEDAGIPEAHIAEIARLLRKQKKVMPDEPGAKMSGAKASGDSGVGLQDFLDDEAEPYEDEDEEEALPSQDPMHAALLQLTEIATQLSASRRRENTLDAILDSSGGAGSQADIGNAGSSSRRNAAAWRALRDRLTSQPKDLVANLEQRLQADFALRTTLPGSGQIPVTCRAWLEMRSKVQSYPTTIRFLWAVAGVADAIKDNKIDEAYCRCLLTLAAGDQLSIDRGSWSLAAEVLLEDGPPFGAFGVRPLPSGAEQPFSRLIDPRWLDLFVCRLKEVDAYLETRRKLGQGSKGDQGNHGAGSDEKSERPDPKRKQWKGGGKGGGGRGAAEADK